MRAAVRRAMQQAELRAQRERSAQRRQEIARNGGRARAEKLTPERRREIARLGGKARREKIHANVDGTDVDHNEVKRQIAALVLVVRRGYSAAQIEHEFGWDRREVERWIEDWQATLSKHMQAQLG